MIDERLLDCDTQPEVEENFNRVMGLIDAGGGSGGGGDFIRTIRQATGSYSYPDGYTFYYYGTLDKPITMADNVFGIVVHHTSTNTKHSLIVSNCQSDTLTPDGSYYYYADAGDDKVVLPSGETINVMNVLLASSSGETELVAFDEAGHVIYREEQPPD